MPKKLVRRGAKSSGSKAAGRGPAVAKMPKAPGSGGGGAAAASPQPAPEAPFDPELIRLHCRFGNDQRQVEIRSGRVLQRAAMEWTYILRNRRRWSNVDSVLANQVRKISQLAERLEISPETLAELGRAEVIEVEVPYTNEGAAWEGRVFPWEHVIAAGTREVRRGRALTIVRRLRRAKAPTAPQRPIRNVLLVEATPGTIGEDYNFEAERSLVRDAFSKVATVTLVEKASLAKIADAVKAVSPEIIHVAGCDTHQAAELLHAKNPEHDGLCLDGADGEPYYANAYELARALRNEGRPAMLVGYNIFNSAARTAAMTIAEGGALASIGFQDYFSERFAEEFFARLYWAMTESGSDVLAAFRYAWAEIRNQLAANSGAAGTGTVLWGAHSWLESRAAVEQKVTEPLQTRAKELQTNRLAIPKEEMRSRIQLKIEPYDELNYSVLHNRQRLFKTFIVSKPLGRLEAFDVAVQLNAGQEQIPFDQRFSLESKTADLRDKITLPLTSTLMRTLRESVRSTVRVEVRLDGERLFYETMPVKLLAIDEWKDDDENRVWLPSFVLPRDPAVLRIVDAAQKYLCALTDDANAGFDGYQCVDKAFSDPYEGIDLQAQAIWWAIVTDFQPAYVNPPPTYSKSSQRLRTPSDVIEGKRGTCIDLALLYLACLEYIEIYPAMILLEGHAFPAYWRSDEAFEQFRQVRMPDEEDDEASPERRTIADASAEQAPAWYMQKTQYREILQSIRAGHLVPIETVCLTSRSSFSEALDEGMANMRSRADFHSMLDIRMARERDVTPLPFRVLSSVGGGGGA